MHHLLDGLVILERPLRKRRIDRVDVACGALGREVPVTPGQSGQPRPAALNRTQAPNTMTTNASTAPASARRRNQMR